MDVRASSTGRHSHRSHQVTLVAPHGLYTGYNTHNPTGLHTGYNTHNPTGLQDTSPTISGAHYNTIPGKSSCIITLYQVSRHALYVRRDFDRTFLNRYHN